MDRLWVREVGSRVLTAAEWLMATGPDLGPPVAIGPRPAGPVAHPDAEAALAAVNYVWDEVRVVQTGRATGLWVLADEVANARRLLARL